MESIQGGNEMEFLFDVKLISALRIKAESEAEARRMLTEALNCAEVNYGSINGDPLVGEASLDGELDLVEVDGEFVQGM
jgi:hypothetical protein